MHDLIFSKAKNILQQIKIKSEHIIKQIKGNCFVYTFRYRKNNTSRIL